MTSIKKFLAYLAGLFSLLAIIYFQKNENNKLKAQLENTETKKDDAKLGQHTADIQASLDAEKQAVEQQKAQPTSNQELLDFLNKEKKND